MQVVDTPLPGIKIIEPAVFEDSRGFFMETWNARQFSSAGIAASFVQDNYSRSARGVLRGLHYQLARPQGKLVRVSGGEVFDVVVDIRVGSPTFGKWFGIRLSDADRRMLWVPPGLAHGFLVMSAAADVLYKCTDYYDPASERTIIWNDPALAIEWPLADGEQPVLSDKDRLGVTFAEAELKR
jgi:dTDP-4-dehydrorhamnose 3,5-epimerase